jgi:hypothetical protein
MKRLSEEARVELQVRRERLRLELRLCVRSCSLWRRSYGVTRRCGCRIGSGLRVSGLGCLVAGGNG